jgi:hypothetical protein
MTDRQLQATPATSLLQAVEQFCVDWAWLRTAETQLRQTRESAAAALERIAADPEAVARLADASRTYETKMAALLMQPIIDRAQHFQALVLLAKQELFLEAISAEQYAVVVTMLGANDNEHNARFAAIDVATNTEHPQPIQIEVPVTIEPPRPAKVQRTKVFHTREEGGKTILTGSDETEQVVE